MADVRVSLGELVNYRVELPDAKELKLYYNDKVYSPEFSAVDTVVVAWQLINQAKVPVTVLDVACGSGVVGLSLKKLFPDIEVTLTDISPEAVRITRLNAKRNGLNISAGVADLTEGEASIVTANLPTFTLEDMVGAKHGPASSYFAGSDPLELYERLFAVQHPILVCECQSKYHRQFLSLADDAGYRLIMRSGDSFALLVDKSTTAS